MTFKVLEFDYLGAFSIVSTEHRPGIDLNSDLLDLLSSGQTSMSDRQYIFICFFKTFNINNVINGELKFFNVHKCSKMIKTNFKVCPEIQKNPNQENVSCSPNRHTYT